MTAREAMKSWSCQTTGRRRGEAHAPRTWAFMPLVWIRSGSAARMARWSLAT